MFQYQQIMPFWPTTPLFPALPDDIDIINFCNTSTIGPPGPQGIQGPEGPQGPQGVQGLPGISDNSIASNNSLGVVQIGNGLHVTNDGILSVSSNYTVPVKIALANYTALSNDCYIGALSKGITITLPAGITGKVYIIKSQVSGNITLACSNDELVDNHETKILGTNACLTVLFNGTNWSIISQE